MFEGLKKISVLVEFVGWLAVTGGAVLAVFAFGDRAPFAGLAAGGALVMGGLLLALAAQVARAVAFMADAANEERNALPLEGGGRAPGWLVDVRYGRELRKLTKGRYWSDGRVHESRSRAEDAIRKP